MAEQQVIHVDFLADTSGTGTFAGDAAQEALTRAVKDANQKGLRVVSIVPLRLRRASSQALGASWFGDYVAEFALLVEKQ